MLAYGIHHLTAPVSMREKLSFQTSAVPHALRDLVGQSAIEEAVILSTCNRTEIYTNSAESETLQHWLSKHKCISVDTFRKHCYSHRDEHAIKHMMRVASGLDSMMLGETQVFGQIKEAYFIADKAGTVGAHFRQIFPAIFTSSKAIRSNT